MKCAIMQPYFAPYIGYFQLISAVDCFVLYDDVNFIKGGWINRNFILGKNEPQRITLQLSGASPNKLINKVKLGNNRIKLLKTIEQTYSKAPYFNSVIPIIEKSLCSEDIDLSRFIYNFLSDICQYIGISTEIRLSSKIDKNLSLKGSDKVIEICKYLQANTYINAIGGKDLYDKRIFKDMGIELYFLDTEYIEYKQFSDEFLPNLSIIDIMMFNNTNSIEKMLRDYKLV